MATKQLEKGACRLSRWSRRGNSVNPRSNENLVVDAALQNRIGKLRAHVVVVRAGASPPRKRFEPAERAETNHQPFNVRRFANAHSNLRLRGIAAPHANGLHTRCLTLPIRATLSSFSAAPLLAVIRVS